MVDEQRFAIDSVAWAGTVGYCVVGCGGGVLMMGKARAKLSMTLFC